MLEVMLKRFDEEELRMIGFFDLIIIAIVLASLYTAAAA